MSKTEIDSPQFRRIVIPSKHIDKRSPDKKGFIIDVTPIDDEWLLDSERRWAEIDQALEARLEGLQNIYEDELNIGMNSARLLAYSELLDEYRLLAASYKDHAEVKREKYEEEKAEIKDSRMSHGKQTKLVTERWKEVEPEIVHLSEKADGSEQIGDYIARKAFLDFFSIANNHTATREPLILQDLPSLVRDVQGVMMEDKLKMDKEYIDRKPVAYLLQRIITNTAMEKNQKLYGLYSYKNSEVLISKWDDIGVLARSFDMVSSSPEMDDPGNIDQLMGVLGIVYLNFLSSKAAYDSHSPEYEGKYPYLTLVYDMLLSASVSGDPTAVRNSIYAVDHISKKHLQSGQISREIRKMAKGYTNNTYQLASSFVGASEILIPDSNFLVETKDDASRVPQEFKDYFTSEECRLIDIFELMSLPITETNRYFYRQINKHMARVSKGKEFPTVYGRIRGILKNLDTIPMLESLGIEVSFKNLFSGGMSFVDWIEEQNREKRFSRTSAAYKQDEGQNKIYLGMYKRTKKGAYEFHYRGYQTSEAPNEEFFAYLNRENMAYWDEIVNKAMWFISPRGDRFSSYHDEGLRNATIDYITFYVDRNYPREHRVLLKFSADEEPHEFWLDTNRNLLGADHRPITGDPRLKSYLTNHILSRLHFVTSGLATKAQDKKEYSEKDGENEILFRRAHYMRLVSTEKRTITMGSPGVDAHAAEILKVYGIDIFKEILRRRALGVLKPHEYITFSREVVKGNVNLFMPNDIVYDPSLVKLDIYNVDTNSNVRDGE